MIVIGTMSGLDSETVTKIMEHAQTCGMDISVQDIISVTNSYLSITECAIPFTEMDILIPLPKAGLGSLGALTVISSYALREMCTNYFNALFKKPKVCQLFRFITRPRRCFGNGVKYRMCSTRVI